jgi:hypothetical protein
VLKFLRFVTVAGFIAVVCAGAAPVWAQARYDGKEPRERFSIRIGGFRQNDIDSTFRIDSLTLGLGTLINLEDTLLVDDEVTVARMDGFFRFNPRHRLEWAFYRTDREGTVTILEDIQIGDTVFLEGETLKTETESGLFKIGWSWSVINVEKYEFFLGAGLNFRDLQFVVTNTIGGSASQEAEDVLIPLPVLTFGGRYNFTGKSSMHAKYEVFSIDIGDFEGRFQESTLLFEHNTFGHFGFGGGLSSFNFDLEVEDSDWRGEVETSYAGFLVYAKAYF